MDFGKVNVAHIVGGVVIANLAAGPVHAFDLDDFVGLDGSICGVVRMPSVLSLDISIYFRRQSMMSIYGRVSHTWRHSCSAAGLSSETFAA
jgi:hypothetical protein